MWFIVEVIGNFASDAEPALSEAERRLGEERLRRLLVGAPADRAWRRRGCVVLCRNRILSGEKEPPLSMEDTRPQERQETTQEGQGDDGEQRRRRSGRGCVDGGGGYYPASKVARVGGGEGEGGGEGGRGGGRGGSSTITTATAADGVVVAPAENRRGWVEMVGQEEDASSDRDFSSDVCFRLVELAEEEIFKEIVGFL